MKTNSSQELQEAIIDLYLNVKIRKQDEIENYGKNDEETERDKLRKTSPFTLIEYIKSSVEILIDLKVQEKLQENKIKKEDNFSNYNTDDEVNEYEKLLRKLESDIRSYIKVEHQMKLYAESLQSKIEDLEKQSKDGNSTKSKYSKSSNYQNSENLNYETELKNNKKEIEQMKKLIKTYEEHNLKIPELEKKIKMNKIKYEKELKDIEAYYKEKIKKTEDLAKRNSSNSNIKKNYSTIQHTSNIPNNTINNFNKNYLEYDIDDKNETLINKYSQYASSKLNNSKGDKYIKINPKLISNSKTIEEDLDRVNYNHSKSKDKINNIKGKSKSPSPGLKLNNQMRNTGGLDKKKNSETLIPKDEIRKRREKSLNQNLTNIINDLKNATKKTESRFDSKENTYDFDHENKLKNLKSINNDQQTLDSTYRNDNKTEMSEFNSNSNGVKMHKRYDSHQNINSLLKKNNDYYNNTKSNHAHHQSIIPENINIKSNRISNIPSNFVRKSTGKKQITTNTSNHNREKSREFQDRLCLTSNTPSKNIIDKSNTQNNLSNIILNQNHHGVPCYNNINIYTNGLNSLKNNVNHGESNLKNYNVDKVNHRKSPSMNKINTSTKQKIAINHSKSNSIIGKL